MNKTVLFVPLTKVDLAQRLVYGVAAVEEKDRSKEVFDYETSKAHFETWSEECNKNSGGKSYGNVRAMHGKVAAGRLDEPLVFNDALKQIEVCTKIVDDNEWEKVEEGIYTGFSIGGRYEKRWKDDDGLQRYTAAPVEISLVDSPCMPSARFTMVKADGVCEEHEFKSVIKEDKQPAPVAKADDGPTNEEIARVATELAKADGVEVKWPEYIEKARKKLQKPKEAGAKNIDNKEKSNADDEQDQGTDDNKDDAKKFVATPRNPEPGLEQVWLAKDGSSHKTIGEARAKNKELAKAETPVGELQKALTDLGSKVDKLEKKDYSPDDRKEMAKNGTAMPDGSYPIANKNDLKNAVQSYGRASNKGAVKKWIQKRAAALDATDLLPDGWDKPAKADDAEKTTTPEELRKSLYDCGRLANLIQELDYYRTSVTWEEQQENDTTSTTATELKTSIADLCGILRDRVIEETSEIFSGKDMEDFADLLEMSARPHGIDALEKILEADTTLRKRDKTPIFDMLEKVGAKHSKKDQDLLNTAHDALSQLGMSCGDSDDAEKLAKAGARHSKGDREKLQQAHDNLVSVGADCSGEDDAEKIDKPELNKAAQAQIEKLTAERDELSKALIDALPLIKALDAKVDKLMDQPAQPRITELRTVEKGNDDPNNVGNAAVEMLTDLAKNNPSALADVFIRNAQKNPQRFGGG
jgi:predicted house-cleaning noncanonical NTP pyrophosphatase (MazG superfamily)